MAAQPQVLIHRDFQSQNISGRDGRIRLVDFQGMRLGPLGYDLASLVLDPYVAMPTQFRDELVERFVTGMRPATIPRPDIRAMALAAGLQRIMQALGAYGFLGHVKGKTSFLDHIPAGLAVLREILGVVGNVARGETEGRWLPGCMSLVERLLEYPETPRS